MARRQATKRPKAAPPAPPAPPPRKRAARAKHPHRDYYLVKWGVREFIEQSGWMKTELARKMGVSDSALHLYSNRGESPIMAYKALVQLINPEAADAFERKLTARRARTPSLLPAETLALAQAYDKARVGHRISLEDGGWMTIVDTMPELPPAEPEAPAPEAALEPEVIAHIQPPQVETQTMTIPTAYGDIKVEVPVMRRSDQSDDLLLALAMRLKAERDDAYRELTGLRKQLTAEQNRSVQLQQQLDQTREEIRVYEELMMEQSQPQRDKAVRVETTPEAIQRAEEAIRAKAPSLSEEFARLPKQTAR